MRIRQATFERVVEVLPPWLVGGKVLEEEAQTPWSDTESVLENHNRSVDVKKKKGAVADEAFIAGQRTGGPHTLLRLAWFSDV